MDDEAMIREVGEEMLSLLGYRFAFAEEGDQAIELYKAALESESPFDAVILDLTGAGGLGGKETIKQLLDLDPQVRAIVCSGYSNDPVMANHREYGFRGVLTKPFTMKELDDQIHQVIGSEE
jgi:CheY-like chemotaxis protein